MGPARVSRESRIGTLITRLTRRMFPPTVDFGALLGDQAQMAVDALAALADFARTGDPGAVERVSAIEKHGDRLRERNLDELNRSFTTVFDRALTSIAIRRIDDVANYAKTAVREMGILAMDPDPVVLSMAETLSEGALELRAAIAELAVGGDPNVVATHATAVHKAERQVEKIYRAAFADLFRAEAAERWRSEDGAIEGLLDALRRREVYRHLSNAADRLDDAGRIVTDIAVATV